jgi:DNA-binding CsgD family transcriptional regulator
VLIELGRAESLAGKADALGRLEQALELSHDPRRSAEILRELGWTLQKSGDLQGAVRAYERGLDALSDLSDDDDATARQLASLRIARLGAALNGGLERGSSKRAQREVTALLDKPGSALDANERGLLSVIAMGQLFGGERHDEVIALCKHAWGAGALLETEGSNSQTIWHVIGCLAWADDLVTAEEMSEAALQRARREGSIVTLALGLYARSWPRYWRGELSGAAADAQAAVDAWSGEYSMYLPVAAYWLALSLLALGQVDDAADSLDFTNAEERWGQTTLYGPLLAAQAAVDIARGEHKQAVRNAERCGTSVLGSLVSNPAVIPWRSYLSAARLGAGDRDGAQQAATEELELSRRFGAPRPLGISLRSAGLAAGDKAGLELLEESAHVLRASPARLELARSLVELGAAMRRGGRPAAARQPLREGLELARGFRAVALERQAHEELLASGAKPRRRDLTGLDSLTPSERRVAELAASGMTNREIAQTLFVTLKAVQWHLGHTYRKLNINDRKDLPAALNPPPGSPIAPAG